MSGSTGSWRDIDSSREEKYEAYHEEAAGEACIFISKAYSRQISPYPLASAAYDVLRWSLTVELEAAASRKVPLPFASPLVT